MAKLQVTEFFEVIRQSSLLKDDQLAELRKEFETSDDSLAVAKGLVRRGHITKWQANFLLSGKCTPRIGKYSLIDEIDSNQRRVFLAEHNQMKRQVMLKSLGISGNANGSQTRYLSRAREIASLDHPHIAHVYDFDCDPSSGYFLVMEKIRGKALSELLFNQRLKPPHAVRYIRQVAEALDYASKLGVYHGQLGTTKVLISDDHEAKVLGMGLYYFDRTGVIDEQQATILRRNDMIALAGLLKVMVVGERPSNSVASTLPQPILDFTAAVRDDRKPMETWPEFIQNLEMVDQTLQRAAERNDSDVNMPARSVSERRRTNAIPLPLMLGAVGAILVSLLGIVALILVIRAQTTAANPAVSKSPTHSLSANDRAQSDEATPAAEADVPQTDDAPPEDDPNAADATETDNNEIKPDEAPSQIEEMTEPTNENPTVDMTAENNSSDPPGDQQKPSNDAPQIPPFRDFPKFWALHSSDDETQVTVARLHASPADVSLNLLGADLAIRGAPRFQLEHIPEEQAWKVQIVEAKSIDIAKITLDNTQLQFQWLPEGAAHPKSDHLQNCLLEASVATKVKLLRMREPLLLEPFVIAFSQLKPRQPLKLDALPDLSKVMLKVTLKGNFEQPTFLPGHTVSADRGVVDIASMAGGYPLLAFRIETRLKSRPQITFQAMYRLSESDSAPKPFQRTTLQQLTNSAVTAEATRAQLEEQIPRMPRGGNQNRRERLKMRQRELAQQQLKVLEAGLLRLQGLRGACEVMNEQAEIHFEIYHQIGDEKLVLARSKSTK